MPTAKREKTMNKKKIMLAVTGMSPQIITETVFALYRNQNWLPEEIRVITTDIGKRKIVDNLLGEHGFFKRLREDYALPPICFNESSVQVIQNQHGQDLADIRSPEENDLAADQIVRTVAELCRDENTELHVSIAGGRKSMGFYIGYALSLFGRSQDRLSHVLVEEDFEQNPEFYYPSPSERVLNTKSGMRDASQARVMLADIPFVRMRGALPLPDNAQAWNYLEAVEWTQRDLEQFDLKINISQRTICCGGVEFRLAYQDFAVYAAFAWFRRHQPERRLRLSGLGDKDDIEFAERVIAYLKKVKPEWHSDSVETQKKVRRQQQKLQSEKRVVQEFGSRLKRLLKPKLQSRAALFFIESEGRNHEKTYRLATDAHLIKIIE